MLLFCFLGSFVAPPRRSRQVNCGNAVFVGVLPADYTPKYCWEIPPRLDNLRAFEEGVSIATGTAIVRDLNSMQLENGLLGREWCMLVQTVCPMRHREEVSL